MDPSKVRNYLLSEAHPVGRFKAAFFLGLGYSAAASEALTADLRKHAIDGSTSLGEANAYGQDYEVRGSLREPAGRVVSLVSAWIVLRGEDIPRFVTTYPGSKR